MACARAAIAALVEALPDDVVRTDAADLAPHLTDWRGTKTGHADALLLPRCTADVQTIMTVAQVHNIAIQPQGGNTGLVGAGVPEPASDRVVAILSTRRMNAIRAVDPAGLSLVAEAGAILAHVQAAALDADCVFPLSLGAKGSATVGGLAATNAGGTQVLRHGTMRALVLGMEAVLPDGSRLDQLSALRKDNMGYDLKQLLIGAEGTLGIITALALKLAPRPAETAVAWAGTRDIASALTLLQQLRSLVGEAVESFEIMDADVLDLVLAYRPESSAPLVNRHGCHILIELAGPADALATALSAALEAEVIEDATIAASLSQAAQFWQLRESVAMAEKGDGGAVKNDISVAVADMAAFDAAARAMMAERYPGSRPLVFGHLGDGNLHWNLRPPVGVEPARWLARQGEAARRDLHDLISAWQGSISAEHGIGTLKAAELARLGDPGKLAAMRAIKQALDPANICNPGKLFA